jgi:chemotaxis protein methyltransferase CheR
MEVERFRAFVAARLGLSFDDAKLGFLEEVMHHQAQALGQSPAAYLGGLESAAAGRGALRALAQELTVNETYFFRNRDQFRAFGQAVLPARVAARSGARCLNILSAGCASGEEPFSVAMILREQLTDPAWSVNLKAVDVNPAMLEKARKGRYSSWSLRETPEQTRRRWFSREGAHFVLDPSVREAVQFEECNLAEPHPGLWQHEVYDVVFCRNVIMYFTPELARMLVARIAAALAPGGYLFLGHAETLRGLSHDFHLEHTHDTFYYRRRSALESAQAREQAFAPSKDAGLEILSAVVDENVAWVDAIQRATERIQALAEGSGKQGETAVLAPAQTTRHRAQMLELLEQERFNDALALAQTLPAESARDPQMLLLQAALLTHAGKFEQAETVCERLLRLDELNGEAHYLLALCREGQADPAEAEEHDRIAAYLDPAFAMPRLHLGLLARRALRREDAKLEFGQALALLEREEASRLLLFGGGFSREALVALCRAEFIACGGKP